MTNPFGEGGIGDAIGDAVESGGADDSGYEGGSTPGGGSADDFGSDAGDQGGSDTDFGGGDSGFGSTYGDTGQSDSGGDIESGDVANQS
ncbi:MAG TPA: hypothetical protein VGJ44_03550 [Kribbellaceae bacterium]